MKKKLLVLFSLITFNHLFCDESLDTNLDEEIGFEEVAFDFDPENLNDESILKNNSLNTKLKKDSSEVETKNQTDKENNGTREEI